MEQLVAGPFFDSVCFTLYLDYVSSPVLTWEDTRAIGRHLHAVSPIYVEEHALEERSIKSSLVLPVCA